MQQHNCQLNSMNWTVEKYDRIFAYPIVENISFSCDYLKQFHIETD